MTSPQLSNVFWIQDCVSPCGLLCDCESGPSVQRLNLTLFLSFSFPGSLIRQTLDFLLGPANRVIPFPSTFHLVVPLLFYSLGISARLSSSPSTGLSAPAIKRQYARGLFGSLNSPPFQINSHSCLSNLPLS